MVHHRCFSVTVVKVGVLEEFDSVRTQRLPRVFIWLERPLVLGLSTETAITWLEMRASDVAGCENVKASV